MLFSKHLSYHSSSHTGGNIQGNLGLSISLKDTRPPPAVPLKSVMLHEQISAEKKPHLTWNITLHLDILCIHIRMQITCWCELLSHISMWPKDKWQAAKWTVRSLSDEWSQNKKFLKCHAIRHILFQQIHLLYVTSSLTSFTKYSGQNRNTFSTVKTAGSESSVLCLVCPSLRPL